MATLNLSYEDLASVICLAVHLANADGNVTDDEMEAIVRSITDQYNFEGKQDLLKEYINDGMNMQPQEALKRIAAFGPTEKQWTSNFFVKTIVADGNLEENEKSLYWDIMDKCGLPDHNLDTLDGRHQKLVSQTHLQLLEVALEVGRRRDKDQRVAGLHRRVDVGGEGDAARVEMHAGEVGRIVTEALEVLDAIVAAQIPPDVVVLLQKNLGDRGGPRAASQHCYLTYHLLSVYVFLQG